MAWCHSHADIRGGDIHRTHRKHRDVCATRDVSKLKDCSLSHSRFFNRGAGSSVLFRLLRRLPINGRICDVASERRLPGMGGDPYLCTEPRVGFYCKLYSLAADTNYASGAGECGLLTAYPAEERRSGCRVSSSLYSRRMERENRFI